VIVTFAELDRATPLGGRISGEHVDEQLAEAPALLRARE
jgi:hypothetical protein